MEAINDANVKLKTTKKTPLYNSTISVAISNSTFAYSFGYNIVHI